MFMLETILGYPIIGQYFILRTCLLDINQFQLIADLGEQNWKLVNECVIAQS